MSPDPRGSRLARLTAEVRGLEALVRRPGPSRELLACLVDPGAHVLELGLFIGCDFGPSNGTPRLPPGGLSALVTALSSLGGRPVVFTTLPGSGSSGAVHRVGVRKLIRAQEIATRCRVPVLYHLPAASEGSHVVSNLPPRVLQMAALLKRTLGVPQVLVTPAGQGGFEAGVLGGLVDGVVEATEAGVEQIRTRLGRGPLVPMGGIPPEREAAGLHAILPNDHRMAYDMRRVLSALVDGDGMQEFQPHLAPEMLCAVGRIGGISVGILANARGMFVEPRARQHRIGGIIYPDSAEKSAYFIEMLNQQQLPILFVQDVSGFMVGVEAEHAGIIRSGARFVEAMATARVPRLVLTINHASGAGYYAMAAQGFEPDFLFTWASGRMGAMEGESAVNALFAPQLEKLRQNGGKPDSALQQRIDSVRADYERWLDARTAAGSGFVDAILDPEDTRAALHLALRATLEHRGSHLMACRRVLDLDQ